MGLRVARRRRRARPRDGRCARASGWTPAADALGSRSPTSARCASSPARASPSSTPVARRTGSRSRAGRCTPRSGRRPAVSSWTHRRRGPWTSAASTRSRWRTTAPASCGSRRAGSASSTAASSRSSPPARGAARAPTAGPGRHGSTRRPRRSPPLSTRSTPAALRRSERDALDRALASARARDALSLWHLLARVEPDERGRVFDRLAELVPPPDGVTRDGVAAGDRAMRDLGGTSWASARRTSGGCGHGRTLTTPHPDR